MILQSLANYYDYLRNRNPEKIARPGWCARKVSHMLEIDAEGQLIAAIPAADKSGWVRTVPEQVKRSSGVAANALCDNSSYMLGIDPKGKPERSARCFAAARELHLKLLSKVDSPAARAVVRFFETWNPANAPVDEAVTLAGDGLISGGNLVFRFKGREVLEDLAVQRAWDSFSALSGGDAVMRCLVTGEEAPIARLHPAIKGIAGAQSTGASLVGFNAPAFESYGHAGEQGLNAPVSEQATFAYTTALNYLLSDSEHWIRLGDTTVVYWAERNDEECSRIMHLTFSGGLDAGGEDGTSGDPGKKLDAVMKAVRNGVPVEGVDLDAPFYVLGLAPNAARASVRFFLHDSFGGFLSNIEKHYERLRIVHAPHEREHLYPYQLLQEIENTKASKPTVSSEIGGALMRSILGDLPYPEALLQNTLIRTRATQDDSEHYVRKISRGRMAIIKAFLIRNREEQVTVGLDETRTDIPYILGRMFASFESIQYAANPEVNATVKDRYFDSACATPALVFPVLIRMGHKHARKARRDKPGAAARFEQDMLRYQESIAHYPNSLSMEEQGLFCLGYYHQVAHDIKERTEKKREREAAAQSANSHAVIDEQEA